MLKRENIVILLLIASIFILGLIKVPIEPDHELDLQKVRELNEADFYATSEEEIRAALSNGKGSIIIYGSEACPPCVELKKNAVKLYEAAEDINIKYIEVTKNPELLKLYDIQATPSALLFNSKGEPIDSTGNKDIDLFQHYKEADVLDHTAVLGTVSIDKIKEAYKIVR